MAVIHKSRNELRTKMYKRKLQQILCIAGCVAALAIPLLCGQRFGMEQRVAMDQWEDAYLAATAWIRLPSPGARLSSTGMGAVVDVLLRGAGKLVRVMPVLLPWLVGGLLFALMYMYIGPAGKDYAILRSGVEGEQQALWLARALPDSCHVFVNRHIAFGGGSSETDLIIAGPGGVAVVEVKNYVGEISGSVNDRELTRIKHGKAPEPLANPARQVATHVQRLGRYLRSEGLNVWVVPCVVFVNPLAVLNIRDGRSLFAAGQAGTVIASAQGFDSSIGTPIASGAVCDAAMVRRIADAILRAPAK